MSMEEEKEYSSSPSCTCIVVSSSGCCSCAMDGCGRQRHRHHLAWLVTRITWRLFYGLTLLLLSVSSNLRRVGFRCCWWVLWPALHPASGFSLLLRKVLGAHILYVRTGLWLMSDLVCPSADQVKGNSCSEGRNGDSRTQFLDPQGDQLRRSRVRGQGCGGAMISLIDKKGSTFKPPGKLAVVIPTTICMKWWMCQSAMTKQADRYCLY